MSKLRFLVHLDIGATGILYKYEDSKQTSWQLVHKIGNISSEILSRSEFTSLKFQNKYTCRNTQTKTARQILTQG
jgi:hypothetical protein